MGYAPQMSRQKAAVTLGENMRLLRGRAGRGELAGNRAVAKAAGVGEGTVQRARSGDGNITVENLEALARYYRLDAWQLLVPRLDPDNPPRLATDAEIEAEVQRRIRVQLEPILPEIGGLRAPEEARPDGRSAAKPFGDLAPPQGEPRRGDAPKPAGTIRRKT